MATPFNGSKIGQLLNQNKANASGNTGIVTSGGAGAISNFMNSQPKPDYTPGNNTPDNYRVRDYLTEQGYSPKAIGTSGGNVTLNGSYFAPNNPSKDGYNYGTQSGLAGALQNYRGNEQNNHLNTTQNNLYDNVNAAPMQFTGYTPFEYSQANIESDPVYQAALAAARQNIQTGQNNTLANLAANGQGNSSYAAGVAQQIANKEMGNVSNNILPQLIQQAYQRHMDTFNANNQVEGQNYGALQDQISNQSGLAQYLSGENQRGLDNDQRAYENAQNERAANLNAALQVGDATGRAVTPQVDWMGLFRQAANQNTPLNLSGQQFKSNEDQRGIQNQLNQDQFDEDVRQNGLQYALQQQAQAISAANSANSRSNANADNTRAQSTADFNQKMDIWKATGYAPAGIDGVAKDTPWQGEGSGGQPKQTPISGSSAGSLLSQSLNVQTGTGFDGKPTYGTSTDPVQREKSFIDVFNTSGVEPGNPTIEMLIKAGYTTQEINSYKEKYPAAFQSTGG